MGGFEIPEEIAELVSYVNLFRAINQLHVEFVWPVRTGDNLWNQSSQECGVHGYEGLDSRIQQEDLLRTAPNEGSNSRTRVVRPLISSN